MEEEKHHSDHLIHATSWWFIVQHQRQRQHTDSVFVNLLKLLPVSFTSIVHHNTFTLETTQVRRNRRGSSTREHEGLTICLFIGRFQSFLHNTSEWRNRLQQRTRKVMQPETLPRKTIAFCSSTEFHQIKHTSKLGGWGEGYLYLTSTSS